MTTDFTRPQDRTDFDFDATLPADNPQATEPHTDEPGEAIDIDRDQLRVCGDDVSDGGEE